MKHPREIDSALVDAYLARRALDYLVGFTLSPVLWRKLPGARSAGRVQSVALRLVCDRELEIENFMAREYWSLVAIAGDAARRDVRGAPGRRRRPEDPAPRHRHRRRGRGVPARPGDRDLHGRRRSRRKPAKRNPSPPFTTSTLQQEASRKLGFAPAHTMQVAQRLYEGIDIGGETVGLITYMRTDGVQMAPEAIAAIRRADRRRLRRPLRAGCAAPLPDQGQERAGSARGDPPDRPVRAVRARSRATSSPTRPSSTS